MSGCMDVSLASLRFHEAHGFFPLSVEAMPKLHIRYVLYRAVISLLLPVARRVWHTLPPDLKRLLGPVKSAVQALFQWRTPASADEVQRFHILAPSAPATADLPRSRSAAPSPRNDPPEVSVIVPAHDDGVWLDTCLRSVWQQGFESWECIIVDDASIDDTLAVALRYAELDGRFRVVRHVRNRGLAATRNTGIALARGRFVTMLDGDDFLFQNSLRSRWQILETVSDDAIAGSWCDFNGVPESAGLDHAPLPMGRSGVRDYCTGGGENQFISTSPMVRTDVVRSLGGFDASFRTAEDFEFWTRLFRNGFKLVGTGTVGVAYRRKRSSMVSADPLGHARGAEAVYDYMAHRLEPSAVCALARNPLVERTDGIPDSAKFARRMISFLTYACLTEEQPQIDGLRQLIPDGVLDDHRVEVKSAIRDAITRHSGRLEEGLSSVERHRIRDDVMALLAEPARARCIPARRHRGEIDLSRVSVATSTPQHAAAGSPYRELRARTSSIASERNHWDIVLEATTPDGLDDLMVLGRELIENGRSVAAVDAGDDAVRRRAEAEGVHVVEPGTCRAMLVITSGPATPRTNAACHVAVCTERWFTLDRGCCRPDTTIVRGEWEARWWARLPDVRVGGYTPHRASRSEQIGKPVDGQIARRRTETVLVLRAPGEESGPDCAAFHKRYGSAFDFVFGPQLGAQPRALVVAARVPVVMPNVRAAVVVGCAVPVDAIASGTPVIMIGRPPASLPDGVCAVSFEQLGEMLTSVNPVPTEPVLPTEWLAHRIIARLFNGRLSVAPP